MTAPDPGIPHNCNNCSQTVRHNAEIWQFWQFWSKLKSNCNLSRRWPPSVWRWWWRPPHYHTGNVSSAPVGRRQNWDKKYWWEVKYLSSLPEKDFQCFPLFQPDICYLYITPSPMRFPMKQPIMAMKPQKLHSGGGGGDIIVSLKVWYYQSGWHRETEKYELRISSEWRLQYSAASASTAFSRWELPHWLRWPPPPT